MPALLAYALVFVCSAAVLMLEILAGRMLAPYVGVSLETYTAVIGTVLAGIAVGAWGGGRLADRIPPRRLIGPVLVLGGALALCTVPIVRSLGNDSGAGGVGATVVLAVAAFFLPAAVLSAVSPMVVKVQLHELDDTGAVAGRVSAIGTLGALVGTFATGFLLVSTAPTRTLVYGIGAALTLLGLGLTLALARRDVPVVIVLATLAVGGGVAGAAVDQPCEVESAYFCMRVEHDVLRPSGRILWLDDLQHSYVDLDDPSYIQFRYARAFSDAIDVAFPGGQPLDVVHIGGGGFTLPRALAVSHPGTKSTVYEIDPAVVDLARDELGLHTSGALRVDVGDARTVLRGRTADSADLAVGDAFGGRSVPWHLTTREFAAEVDRVLRPDGLYVVNVIDDPPFRFVKAELATLRELFEHVSVITAPDTFDGFSSDNFVLVASHRAIDDAELAAFVREDGQELRAGRARDRFIGDAEVLTDDYAPVDQMLARDRQ
jgi:MFS family permease